jgi:hypothetical protein
MSFDDRPPRRAAWLGYSYASVSQLIPLARFLPPVHQRHVRARIYRWYKDLLAINPAWETGLSSEQ